MFDTILAKGFTAFAQIMVKVQPIWDKYKVLISLVVGLLIGWLVLGLWLFPVEWQNATPGHLRVDYKSAYLAFAAEEYAQTGDLELLQSRLGTDLEKSRTIPWLHQEEQLNQDIETAINNAEQFQLGDQANALRQLQSQALIPEQEAPELTPMARVLRILAVLAVVVLIVGGAGAAYYLLIARNRGSEESGAITTETAGTSTLAEEEYELAEGEAEPVKSFNTPYVLGDDYFDPSFSIEMGADFLGECGIGISETLGAGDPKKVTAFEVWLFDKTDIRTETTVLASDFAYNDPDLRAKLEPKVGANGELVMMEPGQEIILETSSLRVKAKVRELEYAQGASLPANSFVQKIDFELQAWVKQVDQPDAFADDPYAA
jgi:hypothetical protein